VTKKKIAVFALCGENLSLTNLQGFVLLRVVEVFVFPEEGVMRIYIICRFSNEICHGCMSSPSYMLVSVLALCCPSLSSRIGIWLKERKR
jgi:hypothetical protein